MKTDSKISIIVPVYNGEAHIEDTARSVLDSSYQNLELLLVDDGSSDGSLAICRKLAEADSRIQVYHKKNGGISDARNFGLAHATGDYIGFCDQDDKVSDNMYQKMITRIIVDESQAAICGAYRQKGNGGTVVYEQYTDNVFEKSAIVEKLLLPMLFQGFSAYSNDEICIYTNIWKCIISKEFIVQNKLQFRTFVTHEDDFIMLLQLFLCAERISTLSDILYYWNTNSESETYHSAKRYRPDLEARQHHLAAYVLEQLTGHGISQNIIEEYTYVQQCRNALLQLDNLTAFSKKDMQQNARPHFFRLLHTKMGNLRNCDSISYIQSAPAVIPPQNGFVRNTIIIGMLRKNHVISAYLLNRLINAVRLFVEKYQITEKLERRMKGRMR